MNHSTNMIFKSSNMDTNDSDEINVDSSPKDESIEVIDRE